MPHLCWYERHLCSAENSHKATKSPQTKKMNACKYKNWRPASGQIISNSILINFCLNKYIRRRLRYKPFHQKCCNLQFRREGSSCKSVQHPLSHGRFSPKKRRFHKIYEQCRDCQQMESIQVALLEAYLSNAPGCTMTARIHRKL